MTNTYGDLAKALEPLVRLEKAALAIGSMLLDGIDPGWDETQELEAAAVAYAKAMREVR